MPVSRETLDDRALEEHAPNYVWLVAEVRKLRRVLKRVRTFTTAAHRERFDAICADEELDVTVL